MVVIPGLLSSERCRGDLWGPRAMLVGAPLWESLLEMWPPTTTSSSRLDCLQDGSTEDGDYWNAPHPLYGPWTPAGKMIQSDKRPCVLTPFGEAQKQACTHMIVRLTTRFLIKMGRCLWLQGGKGGIHCNHLIYNLGLRTRREVAPHWDQTCLTVFLFLFLPLCTF